MKYKRVKEGIFISRPNRFIANVTIDGKQEVCHVKNTGRCRELLVPGGLVFLQESDNTARKTKYDLIAVIKDGIIINMDSQAPNQVVKEWLTSFFGEITFLKPEAKYKNSRFDFYIEVNERKIFIEVKGVTLEEDGVALFPDAPTQRGVKHLRELTECVKDGFEAYVIFVVQMENIKYFMPNRNTHPQFAQTLLYAKENGVNVLCLSCATGSDSLCINKSEEIIF